MPHSTPAALKQPPLAVSVMVSLAVIALMAVLRLVLLPDRVVPIGYGVPLVIFVWLRDRRLLWATTLAFLAVSAVKLFGLLPRNPVVPIAGTHLAVLDFMLLVVDLMVVAAVVHAVISSRQRLEQRH